MWCPSYKFLWMSRNYNICSRSSNQGVTKTLTQEKMVDWKSKLRSSACGVILTRNRAPKVAKMPIDFIFFSGISFSLSCWKKKSTVQLVFSYLLHETMYFCFVYNIQLLLLPVLLLYSSMTFRLHRTGFDTVSGNFHCLMMKPFFFLTAFFSALY